MLAQAIDQTLAAISAGRRQHGQHGHSSHDHDSVFSELLLSVANALTASLPSGAVCKLFKVNDSSSLGLFGTGYNSLDPVFESVDVIDDTIIQNMKVADDTIIQNMKLTPDQDPA